MYNINPTIQERAFQAANEYWHLILRVKELRIIHGLQNPDNNKPLVQKYSDKLPGYNCGKGWTKEKEPVQSFTTNYGSTFVMTIRDNALYIAEKDDNGIIGPDNFVYESPAKIKTKARKLTFLKAIGWTLIDDPENIAQYIRYDHKLPVYVNPALYMNAYEPEGVLA